MTDSPRPRIPLDPSEQPILDKILHIRDQLSLLKQDRSTYIKTQDVMRFYDEVIQQVEKLNQIRSKKREEQNRGTPARITWIERFRPDTNAVDLVLDDCFQLISLFFLTIGRNHEAPAVYSAISTVKRLLDHLKEAGFYSPKDLESLESHLKTWQQNIERGKDDHSPQLMTLLQARIDVCMHTLQDLQQPLSNLDPNMMETYIKLVSILRSLSACNTRSKYPAKEVKELNDQLLQISEQLHAGDGTHEGKSAEEAYAERLAQISLSETGPQDGESVVKTLLARCLIWREIIEKKQGKIDERFRDTYDKLREIRDRLDQMNLTHAWSLRETDLYSYQRQLDRIDESRVDGNFLDHEGKPADLHAQRTLLYLLRRSYAYIYQYIISSEPVSEALLPIYNQLLTLKRCLIEVKNAGGVDSPRELYPYSMKLNSIDNMKKDGKFMVGNDIPEGQGAVIALLAECFDLAYDLRNEAEEKSESDTNGVNGSD
ncbi:hypothetical protein BDZ85DRAFT_31609 [Elsinoe ampelina]|uniref:Uncharacterized protein n=1 Tax=Elsinoe ampelina TaxID=302913 RepID=A0A6A6G2Y1_9PEZI|nr:hypothetical protein BDZ85DRAFT_31609 [Elsinoe ampelina]